MGSPKKTIVIGAGISGLCAARTLHDAGRAVSVFDKARGVGGRMSNRRFSDTSFDHGVQRFFCSSSQFNSFLSSERVLKVVSSTEPSIAEASVYYARKAMSQIPKAVAEGLDVHLSSKVESVSRLGDGFEIRVENSESHSADCLIISSPLPQTLALMEAGEIELTEKMYAELSHISYHKSISLMLATDGEGALLNSTFSEGLSDSVSLVTDNVLKGVSVTQSSLTIQFSPSYSESMFDAVDEKILSDGLEALGLLFSKPEALIPAISEHQIHRWRYSQPSQYLKHSPYVISKEPFLALCGDGFFAPTVEGAYLSGAKTAEKVLSL